MRYLIILSFVGGIGISACSWAVTKDDSPKSTVYNPIRPQGTTINDRFVPPPGFKRTSESDNSFGYFLRHLPLQPHGAKVHLYDGRIKANDVYDAVIKIDVGEKDLQQCADAVMRLRAEYQYTTQQYDKISFKLNNGFAADYSKWRQGYRVRVNGNSTSLVKTAQASNSYSDYRQYMDFVFNYASTLSLAKNLKTVAVNDIAIGDVWVKGGSPGHAVIVVDMAVNDKGEKVFLIAQSYMPAQEIQILKNPNSTTAWYTIPNTNVFETPEWDFTTDMLKRF